MKTSAYFKIAILFFLFLFPFAAKAQLDLIHYVPPLYAGTTNEKDIEDHWVVLTTPSETSIVITIRRGDGTLFKKVSGVSKNSPKKVSLNEGHKGTLSNPPLGVVTYKSLNKPIKDQGLIFTSTEAFYVNIRHKSEIHGLSLTAKGQAGLGKSFRSGHLHSVRGENIRGWGTYNWGGYTYSNYKIVNHRSHFISVMATEDNTQVTFSDIRVGNITSDSRTALPVTGDIVVSLNEGESYVLGANHQFLTAKDVNKFNGTKISSDKPIAVNSGSWCGSASTRGEQDIGADQIVPEKSVGNEYILLKGQGNGGSERPVVVATKDNTNIFVNGSKVKINPTPLNAGDSYAIETDYFNKKEGTILVNTNHNVYMYQTTAASIVNQYPTIGMNFIPPLSSLGFRQVDIPFINELGTGIVAIYAQKGADVFVNNSKTPLDQASAKLVTNKDEWVVYKYSTSDENVSVMSNKAIYVALSVFDRVVGASGYFSGFTKSISPINPKVVFNYDLGYICSNKEGYLDLQINSTPIPDWYEWYHDIIHPDSIKNTNENLFVPVPKEATKYILKAYFRDPNMDILYNGDFAIGRGRFESDFDFNNISRLEDPGKAVLSSNPQSVNSSFSNFKDVHDELSPEGKMLLAHSSGSGNSEVLWRKTITSNIDIPDNLFILKFYGRLAHEIGDKYSEQYLNIFVNDKKINTQTIKFDKTDAWKSVKAFWRAGKAESATIKIVDANATGKQSIFAIDSISFVPAVEAIKEFNPDVVPSYSYTPYDKGLHLCKGAVQGLANIKYGDMEWFTFLWEKKLADNTFVPITDTSIEGLDTYELEFNNVVEDHAGIYRCTIGFKKTYEQCGIDVEPTSIEVEVFVDEPADLDPLVGKTELCEGVPTNILATISGDFNLIKWSVFRKNEATALDVKENNSSTFKFNSKKDYIAGDYTVRCEVINGCRELIEEINIEILGKAKLESFTVPSDLCDKTAASLVATLEDGSILSGSTIKYSWFRNDESVPFLVNEALTCNLIPDVNDKYYKVAVTTNYTTSSAELLTCKGNELQERLVGNAVDPRIKIVDLKPISVCEGTAHTYNVELETPGLSYTYMWEVPIGAQKDKVVPDDFNSSSFSINPVDADKLGRYTVTVTNNCGSESSTSVLSMTPKLKDVVISIDKEGPYCPDESVEISITDNGEATLYSAKNLTTLKKITPMLSPLTLPVATNEGEWEISVEGGCNALVTKRFNVSVLAEFSAPKLKDTTVCIGQDAKFEVQIETIPSGSGLTYRWTDARGNPIEASDPQFKNIINIADVQLEDRGTYTCVISNTCYSKKVSAFLDVQDLTDNKDETDDVCQGVRDYRIDFPYEGTPEFAWRFNDPNGPILSDLDRYIIPTIGKAHEGTYYCDVTLKCGVETYQLVLNVLENVEVNKIPDAKLDICEGGKTELGISVIGTPKSIKWYKDGVLLDKDNNRTISTGNIENEGTYAYKYVVKGSCDDINGTFEVVVHSKPSITSIDKIESCPGDVNLNMIVTSVDPATSEWWDVNENKLADGLSHTLSGMTYSGKTIDYIAATNTAFCKDFVKATVQVEVYEPISLVARSESNPELCAGEDLELVVEGNHENLTYKWSKGGVALADPTVENIFDISDAEKADTGKYKCVISSTENCNTDFVEFDVIVREHAKITLQPSAADPCQDDVSVTFTVTGTAEDAPSYQWYKDGLALSDVGDFSGSSTSDLTVSNLLGNDKDSYYCKVSGNYCYPIESEKASLIVKKNASITKPPKNITIAENGTATYTVEAGGTEPLTYQWFENGTLMSGEKSSSLKLRAVNHASHNGNIYYCEVSNECKKDVASAVATLTIDPAVKIMTQPLDQHVCEGTNVEFVIEHVVLAAGKACYWEYNDGFGYKPVSNLVGHIVDPVGNTCTLKISDPQRVLNGYLYRATVEGLTSPVDDDVSNVVKLKIDTPAEFSIIGDTKICKNAGASFNADVTSGSIPYTYEWKRDGVTIGTKGINSSLNLAATVAITRPYSVGVTAGVCPAVNKGFSISYYDDLDLKDLVHANSLCPGDDINLIVGIKTGAAVSTAYTWTRNGIDLGTDPTYKFTGVSNTEGGLYKVKVEDKCMIQSKSINIDVLDVITKVSADWANEILCAGDDLLLEAKVTGDNPTYTWTVPAGVIAPVGTGLLNIKGISETNEGTYTCEVTGTCGDPLIYTAKIIVNDVPNITVGIEALTSNCIGENLVLGPILYDGTGESIIWKFNNTVLTGENGISLDRGLAEISEEGNYRVEVTNACGTDFSLGYLDIHPIPTLDAFDHQIACQGENVIIRAVTTGENLTYRWFVDGDLQVPFNDIAELEIPNVQPSTVNSARVYNIECQVSSCSENLSENVNITVNPNTILNKSLKGEVVYVGAAHEFDLDVTGSGLKFEWHHINTADVDKEIVSAKTKILTIDNLSMADAGEYYCKITGDCGIRFTSGYLTVKDPMRIVEGLGVDAIEKCFGEPLNLNISVEGEVFSINWFKGDKNLGHHELNYSIASLDVLDSGTYRCEISGEGARFEESVNVKVYKTTVLNSGLNDKVLCEKENLSWIPDVSGDIVSYNWQHGLTKVSTDATLNILDVQLGDSGIYSLDVTGKCGSVTTEANLSVKKLPEFISKSQDLERCENDDEAIFTVDYEGDNLVYQWQKDDVDILGVNSTVLRLENLRTSDAGAYKCIANSSCGLAVESPEMKLVVIPQLRILSESPGMEICNGENAQFLVEVEGTNEEYQWQKDGVDITGEKAPRLTVNPASLAEEGYYNCEISDKCSKGVKRYSNSKKLTVNALPNSKIFGRMTLCVLEDRVAYKTISKPNLNYGWLVDGGKFTSPMEGLRTKITWGDVIEDGKVKLKILNQATGCYSQVDSLVKLRPLPDVKLTALETRGICESEFELSGGFPTGGIYWVNGVSQNTFDPSRGNGEYQVRYSYTDDLGCSNSTSEMVMKIDSLPTVKLVEDVIVGSCETSILGAETKESNIKWSPSRYLDDPNSATPTFTAGETTLYVATVVDKFGCVGNDIVNVTVAPLPLITTINDTIIGECKEIELTTHISGDIEEINWTNPSDLDNYKNANPKLIKRHLGVNDYQIDVTDKYGCVGSASIKVEVLPNPEVGENQFLCQGETLLVDTKDLSNPVWDDGYTAWERTIDKPGEYVLSVKQNDCELKQRIVMNPLPKFELDNTIQPGIVIFEGETLILDPELDPDYGPYVYEWSDGGVLPQLVVSESGTYKLSVEDNIGCISKDTVVVQVKPIGIESPNAFTPLSNNENDRFYLKDINVIDKFEMYIYNRWGELMYQTNEPGYANGWNGTYKGEDCPIGAYVWVVMLDGELKEKGTVILVR